MNDSQFHQLADNLMNYIEESLDHIDCDIDCEINGNVMTLTFENQSKIVINRQVAIHQIWLASKIQGYHFDYCDGKWICNRSQQDFFTILNEAASQQAGQAILFN